MGVTEILLLLLTTVVGISVQLRQCTIDEFKGKIATLVASSIFTDSSQKFTINQTYYNCLSRSDTGHHFNSMSVSILYIGLDDPNNIHEVRYNLQCSNSEWEIVGNQSTALRNNNTRHCEDCTDQIVNVFHCTGYLGKDIASIMLMLMHWQCLIRT